MRVVIDNIDVDVPEIKKLFFCLPLRFGLFAWGIVQLIISLVYCIYVSVFIGTSSYYYSDLFSKFFLFTIFTLWATFDFICSLLVIIGTHKKDCNSLEVCYNYLRVKLALYGVALIGFAVTPLFYHFRFWVYSNMDSWMSLMLFENPAFGALSWVMQLYLLLLINGMMISLGHRREFNTLFDRIRRSSHSILTENIIQESQKEEEDKKIDDVC